jgi:hypothetical protein
MHKEVKVDPLATNYASLNYSFNDPVSFTDPSGADPNDGCMLCDPVFQPYTGFQYSSLYNGFIQDDVIYYRQTEWSGPVFRYAGSALYMDQNVAPGGSGSWQTSTFAGVRMPTGVGWQNIINGVYSVLHDDKNNNGGSVNLRTGGVSAFSRSESMMVAAGYALQHGLMNGAMASAFDRYFNPAVDPNKLTASSDPNFFVDSGY